MLCNLLLVLTRVLTLFNGDMWYVIRDYEGGFNLLAWCWNPPMVVVTVQEAPIDWFIRCYSRRIAYGLNLRP